MTWSQNTYTLVGSVLIVNMTVTMPIFNNYVVVAKRIHTNWNVVMTISNRYDFVAKHIHISWLFIVLMAIFNSSELVANPYT